MKDVCEEYSACNTDQHSFKAYLSRWMSASTQMAPFIFPTVTKLLNSSAKAAVAQCNGAPTGKVCGLKWYLNGTWDGTSGVGQQMAALEVVLGTLVQEANPAQKPVTNSTGGTSQGNPNAGYNASSVPPGEQVAPATQKDRGAAWFLTVFVSLIALWTWWFMSGTAWERQGRHGPSIAGRKRRTIIKGKEKDGGFEDGLPTMMAAGEKRSSKVIHLNNPDGGGALGNGVPKGAAAPTPNPSVHRRNSSMPLAAIKEHARMPDRRSLPIYRGGKLPT